MVQVCAHSRLALATVGSAASALQQKLSPDARLSQRDAEPASARRQLSQPAAELESANDKLADLAAELGAVQQQLSLHCEHTSSASRGLSDRDAQLDTANQMIADKNAELDTANQMLADNNAELDGTNQKLAMKEAELIADQRASASHRTEGMSIIHQLQQQNAKVEYSNSKLVEELANVKQKLAVKVVQFIQGNQELRARNSELADAKLKLASSEGLLAGKHRDFAIVNQMLSQKEAELLSANQKVTKQAEKLGMLTQQRGTPSVSKPVTQGDSSDNAAVSAAVSPVKDMQVCGISHC